MSCLREAADAFIEHATVAGLEAAVPTAPAWTVRRLLAHQGMVHRWAGANLRREECDPPAWNAEGKSAADPVGWLAVGAEELVVTIEEVADDVRARVFLKDAPRPRLFWARRQCHETTIHAVDALAARLGRFPTPQDTWVHPDVALDGIDEVLTGFVTRGTSRFAGVDPVRVQVAPDGHTRGWSVLIRDGAAVTTRLPSEVAGTEAEAVSENADVKTVRLAGGAVGLYLALWNRTDPDEVDDPDNFLRVWGDSVRVRWN